jgi:hypothetical protein
MALVDRVKNIRSPNTEGPRSPREAATTQSLYVGYILILAAIGPVAMLITSPMLMAGWRRRYHRPAVTYSLALIVDAARHLRREELHPVAC